MTVVGRDLEIEELRALLDTTSCVVVVGPAGIGKSALSQAVGPQVWVDLEDATRAEALQDRLARTLACPVDRPEAVLEAVSTVPLLVLDAIEGVEEAVAMRLPSLCERTSVLLTSRRRPRFDAPVLELGPLSEEAGAALLRGRVQSVRQAAALDEQDLRALSGALDGIPLALELAATRLRLYAPRELLDTTLSALQDPRLPPRQQLLEAVRTSWSALSESARGVLAAASLLPGAFDISLLTDAAGRPLDDDVLELLDAALLHPLGEVPPQFRVLASIREVAVAEVEPQQRQALLSRLAASVLPVAEALADDLDGALEHGPVQSLGQHVPVLRCLLDSHEPATRLRAALVLAAREQRAGPMDATLARDETLPDVGPAALRVQWGLAVAVAACHLRHTQVARAALDRIEPMLRDVDRVAWSSAQGALLTAAGHYEQALEHAEHATSTSDDPRLFLRLGAARFHTGDLHGAVQAFERARETPSAFRRAQAAYALCAALRESGAPPDRVLAVAASASAVTDAGAYTWLVPRFTNVRGVVAADLGQVPRAREALLGASAQLRALGEWDDALAQWVTAQTLDLLDGHIPEVLLKPVRPAPGRQEQAGLDVWRSIVHGLLGHAAAAEALGLPSLQVLQELGSPRLVELSTTLAVAVAPGRPDLAETLLGSLPLEDPLVALARRAVQGLPLEPAARLEQRVLAAVAALQVRRIRVASDGSGFVGPDGAWVDIARRRVLRRVLAALAGSGDPLDVAQICAETWPGEQLVGDSGTRRVHVAISTLRGLGLRQAIVTASTEDGGTTWQLRAAVGS